MNAAFLINPELRRQFDEATARREGARAGDALIALQQLAAIRKTWAEAVSDVPYYGSLVTVKLAPATIESWRDVAALPILTRKILQDRPAEFIRRSGQPASIVTTAGSTGTPLRLGMNQAERDLMRIVKLAAWQAFGYDRSSRLFLIWGHAHLLGTGWKGRVNHLKRRLADATLGYRRVDAYRLTVAACESYARELIAFRPIGLIGYASALDQFARYTANHRERFRQLGMRFVLATAEAPPRPDTLDLLEDHFGCPVVQEYGGAEFGQVAFKSGGEPFRVYPDLNHVEAEPADPGDPSAAPLLVTTLYSRYVPLIRYRVGDGVSGPRRLTNGHVAEFDAVAGRINDVIELAPGEFIHSVAVFHCIHQERGVYGIQMVLTDSGIDILLIASPLDRPAMAERITRRLTQVHPLLAKARLQCVDDLQPTRAGKRRWYVDKRTASTCAASPAS